MGFFDKCICCPCLSKKQSVKVCAYILIAVEILSCLSINGEYSNYRYNNTLSVIISIAIIGTLIFLLYGMQTNNPKYLSQFKLVFGIVLAFQLIHDAIIMFGLVLLYTGANSVDSNMFEDEMMNANTETIKSTFKTVVVSFMIFVIIDAFVFIDYYFSTKNYINELLETIESEDYVRKEESGVKGENN
ncbi:hypothetical protein BCR36DRAFT_415278 [Piromyces finnis]|uniref:MARVEL domain-containing protein n=1 Tax=Piromyces finnis TaxID=1754191 RepID=A0A1Y1UZ72_9FUNG|nr:hypothetical protein BCR36DRAFT_415278 [Piromyces finnis]|eukprot:ORX43916.1 hypothetical protein BCR36DRAFT_415278 [Piromyces finnis]